MSKIEQIIADWFEDNGLANNYLSGVLAQNLVDYLEDEHDIKFLRPITKEEEEAERLMGW